MTDLTRVTAVPKLPTRPADAHKGSFGRVLVVGGSRRMSGAVALASLSALRGGAGLVEFAAPETVQLIIAGICPCAVSFPLTCDAAGHLTPDAVGQVRSRLDLATVAAVGPGFDVGQAQRDVVGAVLQQDKPIVIDADGLNALAAMGDWTSDRKCPLVLTPHPGEFSRLTDKSIAQVQADRENLAVSFARQWAGSSAAPLVLLLKGHRTVVTDGSRIYVNTTGNPGMATPGSGDVLTGLTAALVAQKMDLFDATCLAAYLHGCAGDLAAQSLGQPSLIATDIIEYMPQAFREM